MPIDKTINQPDGADSRGPKPPTNPGDAARITTAGEYLASFGVATPRVWLGLDTDPNRLTGLLESHARAAQK